MIEPLFEGFEPDPTPATTRTPAERRRDRQQACIDEGFHPLTLAITRAKPQRLWPAMASIPLHPSADRNASARDKLGLPYTCGSCVFRQQKRLAKAYPKCVYDLPSRATGGELTDVRAWWPACTDYQPHTTPGGTR